VKLLDTRSRRLQAPNTATWHGLSPQPYLCTAKNISFNTGF
jgi:hypothetical protein